MTSYRFRSNEQGQVVDLHSRHLTGVQLSSPKAARPDRLFALQAGPRYEPIADIQFDRLTAENRA